MADDYGPQGWWPVSCERRCFRQADEPRTERGYHPGQFDYPRTRKGRWEITSGAVLTQNTAWTNVERALAALQKAKVLTPEGVLALRVAELSELIRPAGYFNQKSRYLQAVAQWFIANDGELAQVRRIDTGGFCRAGRATALPRLRLTAGSDRTPRTPRMEEPPPSEVTVVRSKLLTVLGVGEETADSILLYAYHLPTFVIDAYTRRALVALGVPADRMRYAEIQRLMERALPKPQPELVPHWQEAHALLVEHAKRNPKKRSS